MMFDNDARSPVTYRSARLPIFMLALAGATAAAVVLNIVLDPLVPWGARIATVCLFVPVAALTWRFGRRVFWRGPLIVINNLGIFDRRTMSETLPWEDISVVRGTYTKLYGWLVPQWPKSETFEVELVTRSGAPSDSRSLFGRAILGLFRPTPYTGRGVTIDLDLTDATLSGFIASCRRFRSGGPPDITDNLASVRYALPLEALWFLLFAGCTLATFGIGFVLGLAMLASVTEPGEGWFEPIGVAMAYSMMFASARLAVQARLSLRRLRGISD